MTQEEYEGIYNALKANNIRCGVWYHFENKFDKRMWLNYVAGILPDLIKCEHEYVSLLKVCFNKKTYTYSLRFRTNYNPRFDVATQYVPPEITLENDVESMYPSMVTTNTVECFKKPVYEFNLWCHGRKINKGINKGVIEMNNLILNAEQEARSDIKKKYEEELAAYIRTTNAGKILTEAFDEINKILNYKGKIDWYAFYNHDMLLPKELVVIEHMNKKRDEALIEIKLKIEEAQSLFNMADTFAEKKQILQDYGILKYGEV